MIVIPKAEIDRENELRYDLLLKKNAYARLVFERSKTDASFIGTQEQIEQIQDQVMREQMQAAYTDCLVAASRVNAIDTWFNDMIATVEQIRKDEENKEAK